MRLLIRPVIALVALLASLVAIAAVTAAQALPALLAIECYPATMCSDLRLKKRIRVAGTPLKP
jgi:hypothetical protein